MNTYELTLVLDGKSGVAKKNKVTETLKKLLDVFKGKVVDSKDWGTKELAYKIGKSTTGLYLFFELELDPKGVKSVNDKLRVDADILRFLLIRSDK
jgi:small subunit ribosomal protein S6